MFLLNSCFIWWYVRVLRSHFCVRFGLEKSSLSRYFIILSIPVVKKNYVDVLKEFVLFRWQLWVETVANWNISLQNQNCFRKQVSRVQIFTTGKNLKIKRDLPVKVKFDRNSMSHWSGARESLENRAREPEHSVFKSCEWTPPGKIWVGKERCANMRQL